MQVRRRKQVIDKEQRLALSKSCGLTIAFLTLGLLFKQEQRGGVGNCRRGQMVEKRHRKHKSVLSFKKKKHCFKKALFPEKTEI